MAYTPTTWATGDTITAALLNKMEGGIADAGGGGGILVATDTEGTLDKTWQEIFNASLAVVCIVVDESGFKLHIFDAVTRVNYDASLPQDEQYNVTTAEGTAYYATSANGYPVTV